MQLMRIEKVMGGKKEAYSNLMMTKDFVTEILKAIVLNEDYIDKSDRPEKVFYN